MGGRGLGYTLADSQLTVNIKFEYLCECDRGPKRPARPPARLAVQMTAMAKSSSNPGPACRLAVLELAASAV